MNTKPLTHALYSYSCPFSLLVPTHRDGHEWKKRARVRLAPENLPLYRPAVAAKSVTGRENPSKQKAHSAQDSISGVFLCLRFRFMAAVRGQTSVWPGFLLPRYSHPTHRCHLSREKDRGSSSKAKGAIPMQFSRTQSPSAPSNKAAAHRAMAMAALHANSSLSVRLKRYNHHMDQARALEAQGGVQ